MIRFTKPCDECGGTDEVGVDGRKSSALNPAQGPCPSCVSGMLPDDDTVEAGGLAMLHAGGHFNESPNQAFFDDFRAGLIAAARYQSEENV